MITDFPEIVPLVSAPLILDTGLPFDPVREWPACFTGFIRAHDDSDGARAVVIHVDEFLPVARFDYIRYGWMLAEKLLCVIDGFPELTVSTVLKNSDEFLRDSLRRIGL